MQHEVRQSRDTGDRFAPRWQVHFKKFSKREYKRPQSKKRKRNSYRQVGEAFESIQKNPHGISNSLPKDVIPVFRPKKWCNPKQKESSTNREREVPQAKGSGGPAT